MPLIKRCRICKAQFKTKPYFVRHGGGKYCSAACHHQGIRKGKMVSCFLCGKQVYKSLQHLKRSKSGKYFCTKSCQTKWRNTQFIGPKHANWVHGRSAYKSVLIRHGVPRVCRLCKTKDVRVLAVHHIDKNRSNNRLENLAWLCHNCHFLIHHYQDEKEVFMATIV